MFRPYKCNYNRSAHEGTMKFEWDEFKNQKNIEKHGIDFLDVSRMFDYPMAYVIDQREDYREDRCVGIGWIHMFLAVVVFTERLGVIRIISARKATRREARLYEKAFKN